MPPPAAVASLGTGGTVCVEMEDGGDIVTKTKHLFKSAVTLITYFCGGINTN